MEGSKMAKSRKSVLIGTILAAVLLAGLVGGVALAQTTASTDSGHSIMGRVAAILGIDQQKVEDAFAQAQKEAEVEALDARLKTMVEEGTITQPQADQYKAWWQSRPDVLEGTGLPGVGGRGVRGFGGQPPEPRLTPTQPTTTE
jgi:hypothetical protein